MMTFEVLLGIKINLQKTEMFALKTNQGSQLISVFRCKVRKFSFTYLGLPSQDSRLKKKD